MKGEQTERERKSETQIKQKKRGREEAARRDMTFLLSPLSYFLSTAREKEKERLEKPQRARRSARAQVPLKGRCCWCILDRLYIYSFFAPCKTIIELKKLFVSGYLTYSIQPVIYTYGLCIMCNSRI